MAKEPIAGNILYGTSACHLCEVAEAQLLLLGDMGPATAYSKVDISDSDTLFERYGTRIPVLQRPDETELDWPFGEEQLRAFLRV